MIERIRKKYAMTEKGAKDYVAAVFWSVLVNISKMLPVGVLATALSGIVEALTNGTDPRAGLTRFLAAGILALAALFVTFLIQYKALYEATYRESANRRIRLAEVLRQLPLSFFGNRDLTDLTTTIMGDTETLEKAFSHFYPAMHGALISTALISTGMLLYDWRMALALLWVVPASLLMVYLSRRMEKRHITKGLVTRRAATDAMQEVLEQFDFGVSTFAFEEEAGQHLAPLSLFPDPLPELPQLTAGDAAVSTETLLTALGFNPHTNSRYVDSGGAEVIVEGDRVIRLGSSGALSYSSGGEAALTVEGSGTVPSASEAVSGALALLEQLLPEGGETTLYLSAFRRTESETHLTFSYQFNGVPIHFADGSDAAEINLTGNIISTLSLRPMLYLEDGSSALLPLRQAMAIAERQDGAELSIGYADAGTYPLSAVWLAD